LKLTTTEENSCVYCCAVQINSGFKTCGNDAPASLGTSFKLTAHGDMDRRGNAIVAIDGNCEADLIAVSGRVRDTSTQEAIEINRLE
jgi:hypothetical protein